MVERNITDDEEFFELIYIVARVSNPHVYRERQDNFNKETTKSF